METNEIAAPYQQHSEESRAAAAAVESRSLSMERTVYRLLRAAGENGMTDMEIMAASGFGDSARPRRIALVQKGLVADSLKRRKTPRGRDAAVWITTPAGEPGTLFEEIPQ